VSSLRAEDPKINLDLLSTAVVWHLPENRTASIKTWGAFMSLDANKLQKPFRKLRKYLKNFPGQPTPEQVHDLRTNSRKLESVVHALDLDQQPRGRRLLRATAPIRKDAGKVRDMDVLTGFSSTLVVNGEEECLVQLLEHLGAKRARSAKKLLKVVDKNRAQARRLLKDHLSFVDQRFAAPKDDTPEIHEWPATATAAALQLSRELAAWPNLRQDNLHPYRLKIKELRYVLQLRSDPDDEFVEALGEAKDAIGEWHDWSELEAIGGKVIDHRSQCKLLQRIRSTVREKFEHAMSLTVRLKKGLEAAGGGSSPRRRRSGPVKLREPIVTTAAKLAA
jgi:CHAD domain-containing protein